MIYVMLADGFEEIEMITPLDILRRAGIDVQTVGVYKKCVCGAHGVEMNADIMIDEVDTKQMEMLMLPGGMGHELLDASNAVHGLINDALKNNKYIASICAAPSILGKKMIFDGKKATCFPGYEKYMYGAEITGEKCTVDGKLITARGAGAAADFGFKIVELLKGADVAKALAETMQY